MYPPTQHRDAEFSSLEAPLVMAVGPPGTLSNLLTTSLSVPVTAHATFHSGCLKCKLFPIELGFELLERGQCETQL